MPLPCLHRRPGGIEQASEVFHDDRPRGKIRGLSREGRHRERNPVNDLLFLRLAEEESVQAIRATVSPVRTIFFNAGTKNVFNPCEGDLRHSHAGLTPPVSPPSLPSFHFTARFVKRCAIRVNRFAGPRRILDTDEALKISAFFQKSHGRSRSHKESHQHEKEGSSHHSHRERCAPPGTQILPPVHTSFG